MIINTPIEGDREHLIQSLVSRLKLDSGAADERSLTSDDVELGGVVLVPELTRSPTVRGEDLAELMRSVEALLGLARRLLDVSDRAAMSARTRRELEIACDSLTPQLLSTDPNVSAVAALFGQIVAVLADRQRSDEFPEASAILLDASELGTEDPLLDGERAQAVVQGVFDHAVETLGAVGPASPDVVEEVISRVRHGASAGRSGAMDDVERRVQRFVEGLPGLVVNGAWVSASAVATTAVHLAAADPRLTAGTGLLAVVLRFVLAVYTRRVGPPQP
jgi:hypothetical protein